MRLRYFREKWGTRVKQRLGMPNWPCVKWTVWMGWSLQMAVIVWNGMEWEDKELHEISSYAYTMIKYHLGGTG